MKKMLRKLSLIFVIMTLCVSAFSCFSVIAAEDTETSWSAVEKADDVAARFAVLSDGHMIKGSVVTEGNLETALTAFDKIGGIDSMLLVGDMAYIIDSVAEDSANYGPLMTKLENHGYTDENGKLVFVMGNHEYTQNLPEDASEITASQTLFLTELGRMAEGDTLDFTKTRTLREYNGVTVIGVSSSLYANDITAEDEAWAKEQILAAVEKNPTMPVFYLQHAPVQNTVYGSSNAKNSAEFIEWLKAQKNVVNLTAHVHASAYDPRTFYQSEAGYTAIQSSHLAGGNLSKQGCSDETYENITGNLAAYGMFIDVMKDGTSKVYRMNMLTGEYIGEPIVIDTIDETPNLQFTDARYDTATVAQFPADSEVTVTAVDGHSITVEFPQNAAAEDTTALDGFVHRYKVECYNKETQAVSKTVTRLADFWNQNPRSTRTAVFTDLLRDTEYEIRVYPVTPYGALGTPITTTVSTTQERTETDTSLMSTKVINVAVNKPIYASRSFAGDVDANGVVLESAVITNLVDDNRKTCIYPGGEYTTVIPEGYEGITGDSNSTDWFIIDLGKRFQIDSIQIFDRIDVKDNGGRCNISFEGSNDISFKEGTYDVIDTLGNQDTTDSTGEGDCTLFPENSSYTAEGNGNAYRYIRIRRNGGYYYGYSEIKVWAKQDVTEVTRKKNVIYDNQYSSSYAASKAVNGTISNSSDAWVSEQSGKYHFLTVDMDSYEHIALVEMYGRCGISAGTNGQRQYWHIYGSNTVLEDKTVLTDNATLKEEETGYKRLFKTGAITDYPTGEYIFPEYPGKLQRVVSDENAYRYLTFKRGNKGSTYLGEVRGFIFNPMINSVEEENDVITVEFSDVMDSDSVKNALKVYDASTNEEITAEVSLSEDGYTATAIPSVSAPYYQIDVAYTAKNTYGNELKEDYSTLTTPENLYTDFEVRKDIYANVAQGKPITSSGVSVYGDFPLKYANDGWVGTSPFTDYKVGTSIGTGKGYIQIDLQNRYNLEKIEIVTRQDNQDSAATDSDDRLTYIRKLKVSASKDGVTFDTLDEIDAVDTSKLDIHGMWTINLDGLKDYRYLRVERTQSIGEWGFSEIRAFAKFDGISLTKNATADSYFRYGKGEAHESAFLPKVVLDGNTGTFHYVYVGDNSKPSSYYTYFQIDMKKPYHVGYAEIVARDSGWSGKNFYQHFGLYGSNIGDTVTDENYTKHPYTTTKWLENVEGYTALSTVMGYLNLNSAYDNIWPFEAGGVYKVAFDDSEAYQYITHKTNSTAVGAEFSEMRLYSIAQRVNSVSQAEDGTVTLNFSSELMPTTATEDKINLYNADGNAVSFTGFTKDDYTISFVPDEDIAGGKVVVSEEIMNHYAVPMAADYEYTFEAPEIIENALFSSNGIDEATELKASTEYTFTADYNNLDNSEKTVYAYIVIRDKTSGKVKAVNVSEGIVSTGTLSVSVTTGESVEDQIADVYIWYDDMNPIKAINYFNTAE